MRGFQLVCLACLLAAACSSPAKRIKKNQAAFDASTPAAQQSIREGKVEVGFTPDQVVMAYGKPDRVYSRRTPNGDQEVWAWNGYGSGGSHVGIGFGYGTGYYHHGYTTTGVALGTSDGYYEDEASVVFQSGRVVSVERREK